MDSRTDMGVYVISVAAQLAGVHPQTIRIYERRKLIRPKRTEGGSRRFSDRDVERLRDIQRLTAEGVNLAGVKMVMDLQSRLDHLRGELESLRIRLAEAEQTGRRRGALVRLADVRDLFGRGA